jgi:hypothetical protein
MRQPPAKEKGMKRNQLGLRPNNPLRRRCTHPIRFPKTPSLPAAENPTYFGPYPPSASLLAKETILTFVAFAKTDGAL